MFDQYKSLKNRLFVLANWDATLAYGVGASTQLSSSPDKEGGEGEEDPQQTLAYGIQDVEQTQAYGVGEDVQTLAYGTDPCEG